MFERLKARLKGGQLCYKDGCTRIGDALIAGSEVDGTIRACSPHAVEFMIEHAEPPGPRDS